MIVDAPLLLKKAAAAPADDYTVDNSLKFDGSSSYLSRTFASDGDTTKWTWASWVKLSGQGDYFNFFRTTAFQNFFLIVLPNAF